MSVQAYLPRLAFDALDLKTIVAVAQLAGVERTRVESSTHKIPSEQPAASVRVTCSLEMALCLIEALRQQAARADERQEGALVVSSALAVKALLDAIETLNKAPTSQRFGPNS